MPRGPRIVVRGSAMAGTVRAAAAEKSNGPPSGDRTPLKTSTLPGRPGRARSNIGLRDSIRGASRCGPRWPSAFEHNAVGPGGATIGNSLNQRMSLSLMSEPSPRLMS